MRSLTLAVLFLFATPLAAQEVYATVDEPPVLIGGIGGLAEQVQYPKLAKLGGVEGVVFVQFVVDESGAVRDAEVIRGVEGGGLNEEALRVVRQARFEPGRQRGEPVKVKFTVPIKFVLPSKADADQ